jgi:hypothetical protein
METQELTKLRFDFIGMMFALAIGQVGIQIGDFYSTNISLIKYPFILSHLGLAVFIISSSWIGWRNSYSTGSQNPLNDNFGISYLILVLDLILVICYFILVKGVEQYNPLTNKIQPDSSFEVRWIFKIFIIYFIWDIASKIVKIENPTTLKIRSNFKQFISRGYQSALSLSIVYFIINPMIIKQTSNSVVLTDIALLFVFILFRALKIINWSDFRYKRASNRMKYITIIGVILPSIGILILRFILF